MFEISTIKLIQKINLVLFVVFTMAGVIIFRERTLALGLLVGGLLSVLNLQAISLLATKILKDSLALKKNLLFYFIKFILLILLVVICLKYSTIDKIGFIIGFSTFVISILIFSFFVRNHSIKE